MLRKLLQTRFPTAGLFLLLLILWFFVLGSLVGQWLYISSWSIIYAPRASDLEIINQYWPFRIIQPEWLSAKYDDEGFLFKWMQAEELARLAVFLTSIVVLAYWSNRGLKRVIALLAQS